MKQPNRVKDRFLKELDEWLTPKLLYHCFTGENDEKELARIAELDHVLRSSLLAKVERLWPERLAQLASLSRKEKRESKKAVQHYIQGFEA